MFNIPMSTIVGVSLRAFMLTEQSWYAIITETKKTEQELKVSYSATVIPAKILPLNISIPITTFQA